MAPLLSIGSYKCPGLFVSKSASAHIVWGEGPFRIASEHRERVGYLGTGSAAFQAASDPAPEDSRYFQPNAEARQASGMDPGTSDPLIAMQNPGYLMADYQATHNLGASQHQVPPLCRSPHNLPCLVPTEAGEVEAVGQSMATPPRQRVQRARQGDELGRA